MLHLQAPAGRKAVKEARQLLLRIANGIAEDGEDSDKEGSVEEDKGDEAAQAAQWLGQAHRCLMHMVHESGVKFGPNMSKLLNCSDQTKHDIVTV